MPIFPYGRAKNAGSGVRETSDSAPVPSLANCTNWMRYYLTSLSFSLPDISNENNLSHRVFVRIN